VQTELTSYYFHTSALQVVLEDLEMQQISRLFQVPKITQILDELPKLLLLAPVIHILLPLTPMEEDILATRVIGRIPFVNSVLFSPRQNPWG
jgi:hypothetical protein